MRRVLSLTLFFLVLIPTVTALLMAVVTYGGSFVAGCLIGFVLWEANFKVATGYFYFFHFIDRAANSIASWYRSRAASS